MLCGNGMVAIWNGIAEKGRQDFYQWHIHEHMPERTGIPIQKPTPNSLRSMRLSNSKSSQVRSMPSGSTPRPRGRGVQRLIFSIPLGVWLESCCPRGLELVASLPRCASSLRQTMPSRRR